MEKTFQFAAGKETLFATIDCAKEGRLPTVLSLHGAGSSNRKRISYLTTSLTKNGISSLRFDFSGHGESSGLIQNSSLSKRLQEAKTVSTFLDQDQPGALIGSSMGAHVAIELLPFVHCEKLILFCPAAYGKEVETMPFDENFSAAIRKEKSYQNSRVFEILRERALHVLIFIGENDEVIPKEVVEAYIAEANFRGKCELQLIPNAPHSIHGYIEKNQEIQEKIFSTVLTFLHE